MLIEINKNQWNKQTSSTLDSCFVYPKNQRECIFLIHTIFQEQQRG